MIPTPAKAVAGTGVTGMVVMGSSLARNLARSGFEVAIHDCSTAKAERAVKEHGDEGEFSPVESMTDFVSVLSVPHVAIIMVKAGPATDAVIDELAFLMDPGDTIVDCGNSNWRDTVCREAAIRECGPRSMDLGVSGGEEGALSGPFIMPGDTLKSYHRLGPMSEKTSTRIDGVSCCTHVGPDNANRLVKMVHNDIGYTDVQLIAEAYDLMRKALGISAAEIGRTFKEWNRDELDSYLIEIITDVLQHADPKTGKAFVNVVFDRASQEGAGARMVQNAVEVGVPITGIIEAILVRSLSSSVPEWRAGRGLLVGTEDVLVTDPAAFIEDARRTLYVSRMVAYSQGFELIHKASEGNGWNVDLGAMARIWRGSCIIHAIFLNRITRVYERDPKLPLFLADPYFSDKIGRSAELWRRIVSLSALAGVLIPVFVSSLACYDGTHAIGLPTNLTQDQRDYFGTYMYKRTDHEGTLCTS